jgi:hypothetical protein
MEDNLTKAQRYRALAAEMENLARAETDKRLSGELAGLANQYRQLAEKLVGRHRVTGESK